MSEPRKATDVLLELETTVSKLLDLVQALDLTSKINSNKLNDIIGRLDKQQKITVEAVQNIPLPPSNIPPGFTQLPAGDPDRVIPFVAENNLPQTDSPQGFRRNSRPETYADNKDNFPAYNETPKMQPKSDVMVPPEATDKKRGQNPPPPPLNEMPNSAPLTQGQIPVMQRCVDKNGKSIFLADVYLTDLSTNQQIFKTRTNGTGKWMASLGLGRYRVEIRKQGTSVKEKIEATQDVTVDGKSPKLDLPMLIIK